MVAPGTSGHCKGSETRRLRLDPGHLELAAAALARHGTRPACDRLAAAATGAHRVAVAPIHRQPHGVARSHDHAPRAGRTVDDLQEGRRHFERPRTSTTAWSGPSCVMRYHAPRRSLMFKSAAKRAHMPGICTSSGGETT